MQYSITRKVRITFFIALFFIFTISILSYTSITQLIETTRLVDKTQEMIFHLGQLHLSVKEAETAQRAYLITGDTIFLKSFYRWKEEAEMKEGELAAVMLDYPGQKDNFQELDRLIEARFIRLEKLIQNFQQGTQFSLEGSNETMKYLREIILRMSNEEDALLDNRRDQEQKYAGQALFFIFLFSIVSLLLIIFAFFRIRRDIRRRQVAERKLKENYLLLEEKVEERTGEIRKNEERYRFMAESIPHIVWAANPEGEIDFFSEKLALYTGIPTKDLLGHKWASIIHPNDIHPTMEVLYRALHLSEADKVIHRIRGIDGSYKWAETRGTPYRNEQDEIAKWFGTTTIIDDEVRAKEAARQQEQLLKDITDALPVLISYMDRDFRYRFANRTYEEWFRKKPEEIIGHQAWEVIGQVGFERVKPFLEIAFSGQKVSSEVDTFYEHLGEKHIKFDLIPRYEGENVIGIYLLVHDVSKVKKTEAELRRALIEAEVRNRELGRINLVLDDFVSMAAHDLKSPVSNLKLSLLLFESLKNENDRISLSKHLNDSVNRLDKTLKGLLEIVEVQHVKNASVVSCDFQEVLDEVMINLEFKLKEADGQLKSAFHGCPSIYYIRPYLVSILTNLISNAIKYRAASRPPLIELYTQTEEEGVVFVCRDNGIGMDLNKVGNKLFKPFKRFSSQAEGTGVGLHLIKSIIERNGGSIKVDSTPGGGTTFTCFLKNIQIIESEL